MGVTCNYCSRIFKDGRVFAIHVERLEKHNFTSHTEQQRFVANTIHGLDIVNNLVNDYTTGKLCIADIRNNGYPSVVKLLNLMGVVRSHSEEKLTDRYKNKVLKTLAAKYGDGITNVSQLHDVKTKVKATQIEQFGSYENFKNVKIEQLRDGHSRYLKSGGAKITYKKSESTCLSRYGHSNFGAGITAKHKRIEAMRQWLDTLTYDEKLRRTARAREAVNHRGGYSSKPERRIRDVLSKLGIVFACNVSMYNYNYDMVFDNHVVEVQGDYWHANPAKYKSTDLIMNKIPAYKLWDKDRNKKEICEKNGFTLTCIWESDIIKKSDDELLEFVSALLRRDGYAGHNC